MNLVLNMKYVDLPDVIACNWESQNVQKPLSSGQAKL